MENFQKEEHKAMLTAIGQALDSTIDRYSRVKTEQAIIHTAKKQVRKEKLHNNNTVDRKQYNVARIPR